MSVLHGLKQGNDVLKEIHKELERGERGEAARGKPPKQREYQRVCLFSFHALITFWFLRYLGLYRVGYR